jgi:FKBP-type peptidyl-prolyl cis-trans isomerase 2
MSIIEKTFITKNRCLALAALVISGCATVESGQPVKAGDKVGIHFTCRLPNGEIAAETKPENEGEGRAVSRIYIKRASVDPLVVEAGKGVPDVPNPFGKPFEDEIANRLAIAIVGMKQGETTSVELVAEHTPGLSLRDQYITMPATRKYPKEKKFTREEYKQRTGKDAEVDQPFAADPAFQGKVAGISGDEVLVRFSPKSNEFDLPFGMATVTEKEDRYEAAIHAVKGNLVRSGPLVGRVIEADADSIKLDYGHPFGDETLKCGVKVESVQPGDGKAAVTGGKDVSPALNGTPAKTATESSQKSVPAAQPGTVEPGDLVRIDYTAVLDDGAIFSTTLESAAKDPGRKKVSWFREPARYAPVEIVAGKDELLPGLGDGVLGLGAGAKKELRLTADKAFGQPDPQKLVKFPCSRTLPRVISMPADEYAKLLGSAPVLNAEVNLVPYFKARVTKVTGQDVTLEFLVKNGETFTDDIGTVSVAVAGDQVTTTLKPVIGATFPLKDEDGIIIATDGNTFTVDANSLLAGKNIVINLEVVSLTKAQEVKSAPVK